MACGCNRLEAAVVVNDLQPVTVHEVHAMLGVIHVWEAQFRWTGEAIMQSCSPDCCVWCSSQPYDCDVILRIAVMAPGTVHGPIIVPLHVDHFDFRPHRTQLIYKTPGPKFGHHDDHDCVVGNCSSADAAHYQGHLLRIVMHSAHCSSQSDAWRLGVTRTPSTHSSLHPSGHPASPADQQSLLAPQWQHHSALVCSNAVQLKQ